MSSHFKNRRSLWMRPFKRPRATRAPRLHRDGSATQATAAPAKPGLLAASRAATSPAPGGISCQFDASEPRLLDFQLPDAQGRMVSFHDLDSDLILLDFWGTWCAPVPEIDPSSERASEDPGRQEAASDRHRLRAVGRQGPSGQGCLERQAARHQLPRVDLRAWTARAPSRTPSRSSSIRR